MSKDKDSKEYVTLEISGKSTRVEASAAVCVVYRGKVGDHDDPLDHRSPAIFGVSLSISAGVPMLTLEAGASMVRAGLLAAHIAGNDEVLDLKIERGEITIFASAEDVLELPISQLRDILAVTRQGLVLRAWSAAEGARTRPRRAIVDGIERRLALFKDFAPVVIESLGSLVPQRRPSAAQAQASQ